MWNRASLRTRITLLSAVIFTVVCGILTGVMVFNARTALSQPYTMAEPQPTSGDVVDLFRTTDASESMEASKAEFTLHGVFYMAAAALAGVVCTWFAARRALKPISRLSSLMENINVNNLSDPIPVPPSNDEVARLAKSFNEMLVKLDASFQGQKRFVQNAAHELKTPVTAILANIEVMELDEEPSLEDYKEVVTVTRENAERMSTLIQDLLMVNVESRELFTTFSFRELTEQIMADLAPQCAAKNVKITVEGDTMLRGNKALLSRAFHNIIHNAIRYNYENGCIIIQCQDNKITIADTGIGIPADKLDNIFEPFYCVDASRSRKLGGSGLGLAMVKQIFDQHNIRNQVESKEKQGTTFTVQLPS